MSYLEFDRLRGLGKLTAAEISLLDQPLKNLKTLKISDCDLTHQAMASLASAFNVESLIIDVMYVSQKEDQKGIKELAGYLAFAPKLYHLWLQLPEIDYREEDCIPLVEILETSSSIQTLKLSYYQKGSEHIEYQKNEQGNFQIKIAKV